MKTHLPCVLLFMTMFISMPTRAQEDTEAPVIDCPADITLSADADSCAAIVNFNISATDNCSDFLGNIDGFTSLGSFNGKTYYISNASFGGEEVYDEIAVDGHRLVSIESQAENDFIRTQADNAGEPGEIWIGLNDLDTEGVYVWQNERPVTYINWEDDEPNNQGNEDRVEMQADGTWNDENGGGHPYIIEFSGTFVQTAGIASGEVYPVGTTVNTFVATDFNGNTSTCSFTVTIQESEDPVAVAQNATIALDANGQGIIAANAIDAGSTDNCGISDVSLSQTTFTCEDLGDNTVTLTVTDTSGNTATATAVVTVVDNTAPTVITQNLTVSLDANGSASILGSQVDNGSSDNCGSITRSLDQNSFDCDDIGQNTVTLTVQDGNGNSATGTAIITVVDDTAPTVITQNLTISLDANGSASTLGSLVDNGSSDNCGSITRSLDQNSFDCDDIGENVVTLTVQDGNGNSATGTAIITVVDDTAPTVVTQNLTVSLDANGSASTLGSLVDNGSSDNCGSITRSLDQNSFDCDDIGENTVTLTVQDGNGNSATGTAIITVVDDLDPALDNASVPEDQTVGLTTATTYEMEDFTTNVSATDNCTDTDISQSIAVGTELAPGVYTVTITATDGNGNKDTAEFELTVDENLSISDVEFANLSIFPNPAKDQVLIDGIEVPFTATVFDVSGKLVLTTSAKEINTSLWQSGVYLVKINTSNGSIVKRLMKE